MSIASPGAPVGDGSYRLPAPLQQHADALSLRGFAAESDAGRLALTVRLGGVHDPWNAPLGYSAGVLDVFVKTERGGERELTGTGFSGTQGWQYHLRVTPFGTRVYAAREQGVVELAPQTARAELRGETLHIATTLPAGDHAYWVLLSAFNPLSPDGLLRPGSGGSPLSLQTGRPGMPTPVDLIAGGDRARSYALGTLAPVGEVRDPRPLLLLAVGVLALVLAALATASLIRRRRWH